MKKFVTSLGIAVAAMAVFAPVAADAASRAFCQDYATAAVRQYKESQETPFCARGTVDHSRWSPEFRPHFDWCSAVSKRDAQGERDFRTHYIDECRRH